VCILRRMTTRVKSSVFDRFDVENVVSYVLHASNSNFTELSTSVSSDSNSEVMPARKCNFPSALTYN